MKRASSAHLIRTFTDRYPLVGPAFWLASVQYYVVQLVVAHAWRLVPYSWAHNTISDLGNTVCGPYSGQLVCSPLHNPMNASFITLGVTMIAGSMLIYQEFRETAGSAVGFSLMALAGLGSIVVGWFPENGVAALHITGAALPFILGNLALIIFGFVLRLPRVFAGVTVAAGLVALAALVLFVSGCYLGLGAGGMERVTAYPQTIWLISFGLYMSRNHFRAVRR